tara:strand:+ start:23475 stop:23723 length:249 start_codon:yes stop_codon:yes gene_type:complete
MSNKNPFEIRLEVLKMAQDQAIRNHEFAMETFFQSMTNTAEAWNKSTEELIGHFQDTKPVFPTPEEVLHKAKEMYSFVSKKD